MRVAVNRVVTGIMSIKMKCFIQKNENKNITTRMNFYFKIEIYLSLFWTEYKLGLGRCNNPTEHSSVQIR